MRIDELTQLRDLKLTDTIKDVVRDALIKATIERYPEREEEIRYSFAPLKTYFSTFLMTHTPN